jgi:hypothetical protein
MGTPVQQGIPSHSSPVLSPQARRQSVLSGPGTTTENTSSWTSPHRRNCESPVIAVLPGVLDEAAGDSKESEAPQDHPSEQQQRQSQQQSQSQETTVNAIYENGMRKTAGRGRMTTDYTGIVLPLMDEYVPTLQKPAQAPWMAKVRSDRFGSGMER